MIYGVTLGAGTEAVFEALSDKGLADFQQLKALGFTSVRIVVYYTATPPVQEDSIIRSAVAAGLDVQIILGGYNAATISAATYAAFAAAVTTTYSAIGVHSYEVINEPGAPSNWNTTAGTTNPGAYTALLKLCYAAIHAADPAALVLLGALAEYGQYAAPTGTWSAGTGSYGAWTGGTAPGNYGGSYNAATGDYSGAVNPIAWLQTLYAAGAHGYFDVMNVHPYSAPVLPTDTDVWNGWYQMFGTTPSIYSLMVANGDTATPMWITEYGWLTDNSESVPPWPVIVNTLAGQAAALTVAIQQAALHSQIARFYVFDVLDTPNYPSGDGAWGLYDNLGQPKPALAQVLAGMGKPVSRFVGPAGARARFAAVPLVEV
jgi:hypothetical protein